MKIRIETSLREEIEDSVGKEYVDETLAKYASRILTVLAKIQPELDAFANSIKGVAATEEIKLRVYSSMFPEQDCAPSFGLEAESNKADLSDEQASGSILLVEDVWRRLGKAIERATGDEIECNWERGNKPSWLGISF
jgi:hypothetical protein